MTKFRRESILRYFMYEALRPSLSTCQATNVLSISDAAGLVDLLGDGRRQVTVTQFPEIRMEQMPYSDGEFDLVLSDQVLEHVADPWKAVQESFRVVRDHGVVVHTSCFLNPLHNDPTDYWRFTPDALALLCQGHTIESTGSWGNRRAAVIILYGLRRLPAGRVSLFFIRSLMARSQTRCPIVVWVIARKVPHNG